MTDGPHRTVVEVMSGDTETNWRPCIVSLIQIALNEQRNLSYTYVKTDAVQMTRKAKEGERAREGERGRTSERERERERE